MSRHIGLAMLFLGMAALSGCASAPSQAPATEAASAGAKSVPAGAKRSHCLTETGSHIKAAEGECLGGHGLVITREELERSGSISTGDTLRRLGI